MQSFYVRRYQKSKKKFKLSESFYAIGILAQKKAAPKT